MRLSKSFRFIILIILIATGCSNSEELVAFKNVHLVPMTEEKLVPDQTVLIKGDRIFKIGNSDEALT